MPRVKRGPARKERRAKIVKLVKVREENRVLTKREAVKKVMQQHEIERRIARPYLKPIGASEVGVKRIRDAVDAVIAERTTSK